MPVKSGKGARAGWLGLRLLLAGGLVSLLALPASSSERPSFIGASCDGDQTIWQRARATPRLKAHCAELSSAQANLRAAPRRSQHHATRALELVPASGRALLLASHARLLLGDLQQALEGYALLEEVFEQEANEKPSVVAAQWGSLDWLLAARAALLAEQWELSRQRYRRVALELDSLGSERLAARCLIEAATAALHAGADARLEAEGYLIEAARRVAPSVQPWVRLARSLSRRQGTAAPTPAAGLSERDLELLAREGQRPDLIGSVPLLPEAELQLWLALAWRERDLHVARRHAERLLAAERPLHLRAFDRAVMSP